MKKLKMIPLLIVLLISVSAAPARLPVRILSGEIFIGGTSYGTGDYQTYLAFNLTGRNILPRKKYVFYGEQRFSVYQDHPVHPIGPYEFSVRMPYGPNGLSINGEIFQPVWYADSRWIINSSVDSPVATATSPQFVNVQAPFEMNGYVALFGANNLTVKCTGSGIVDLRFEKVYSRYFVLEARYDFGPAR